MRLINRSLIVAMAAGALALPVGRPSRTVDARGPGAAQAKYSPQSVEHYLSADEFIWVRPGLNVSIASVTNVAPGQKPVVELLFTDDLGQPLDRNGVLTPGEIEAEFMIGAWNAANYEYVNLTTVTFGGVTLPLHDVGGTWEDVAVGDSKYTFAAALPNFDVAQTVTLGIYSGRKTKDIVGKDYTAPAALKTFRPDGGTATAVFAELDTQSCNACHDPLQMHAQFGPPIQDVRLCVMCHTSQMPTYPTGETLDFKILIHKVHRGENLPSVQAGKPYAPVPGGEDFSTVALPQDIRNCTKCHASYSTTPDSARWLTSPTRRACGSCHDDVNFATGANHPAGAQADDSACASCHTPQGSVEFDAGISTAHTVPRKSSQLKGLKSEIVSVTNTGPGQKPTVQFKLTNGDGSVVSPATLGSNINLLLGGPTIDYAQFPVFRERADGAAFDGTTATYTFTNAIPAGATGTWTVSIEARRTVTLNPAPTKGPATVTEGAFNPITYIAVTDATPQERRTVVDLAKCNQCHDQLVLHGGQRFNTFECVMCHNPNSSDVARRPADQLPVESVDFKRMIHRIHTGEELATDYTVYGFGGSRNNFNEVRFPGDRRDCLKCHVPDAYQVPEDEALEGRLPTQTPRDWYSPQQPIGAACLGCHSERHQAAHVFQMTAPFGESCAACHGMDGDFAVDKVHAR